MEPILRLVKILRLIKKRFSGHAEYFLHLSEKIDFFSRRGVVPPPNRGHVPLKVDFLRLPYSYAQ